MTRPIALAITGGIGAGKSEALSSFARHGAAVVSSDEIVHELLRHDEVRDAVVERLGPEVLAADGSLDRAAMAAIVFADPEALARLEALLHPLVSAEYMRWREQLAALPDAPRVCATEVPLLYEVGSDAHFDKVVVITAPEDVRRDRSEATIQQREGRFLGEDEKVARADFAYVNDGTLDELDRFVAGVMKELTGVWAAR